MTESVAYQAILEEGEATGELKGIKRLLLRLGEKHFGPPDPKTVTTLEGIDDLTKLENLLDKLENESSWQDLLEQAAPRPRKRRRS